MAEVKQSNSLRFKTSKTIGKETIYVSIRLDDECKNGHQDFAITGDLYEAGMPKIDRYHICGGCIHDEIMKFFPEFKMFIDLHLCDYKGIPMHAGANGFYHLRKGFNMEKAGTPEFKLAFCEYYRITPNQFDELNKSHNELQYCLNLERLSILSQWEREANAAIAKLEEMTKTKFIVDSVKTQYYPPTQEQRDEEERRQQEGYYTPEAVEARRLEAVNKMIAGFDKETDDKIAKIMLERGIERQVLVAGGQRATGNCIFYTHTKELTFNWSDSYGRELLTDAEIEAITSKLSLPEGIKVKTKHTT